MSKKLIFILLSCTLAVASILLIKMTLSNSLIMDVLSVIVPVGIGVIFRKIYEKQQKQR